MASWFDTYKTRINASGNNISENQKLNTVQLVNNAFDTSPSYCVVTIDNKQVETRVIDTKESTEKFLLFRPDTQIAIGKIVSLNNQNWLITDFISNEIYPKAKIELCNNILKWIDESNITQSYSCVIKVLGSGQGLDNTKIITLEYGKFTVLIQYNENTNKIKSGQRFILNKKAYKVEYVDDITNVLDGVGVLQLTLSSDMLKNTDNIQLAIADNSSSSTTTTQPSGSLW